MLFGWKPRRSIVTRLTTLAELDQEFRTDLAQLEEMGFDLVHPDGLSVADALERIRR